MELQFANQKKVNFNIFIGNIFLASKTLSAFTFKYRPNRHPHHQGGDWDHTRAIRSVTKLFFYWISFEALTIDWHDYAHWQKTQHWTAGTFLMAKRHIRIFIKMYILFPPNELHCCIKQCWIIRVGVQTKITFLVVFYY